MFDLGLGAGLGGEAIVVEDFGTMPMWFRGEDPKKKQRIVSTVPHSGLFSSL